MSRGISLRRIVVIALLAAAGLTAVAAVVVGTASAQWFEDRFPGQRQQQRNFFNPFAPPEQPKPVQVDYSRAPPPRKTDVVPQTHVVVMGDAFADWLAYGLEVAAAESPDIGILRKHRTISGLIRAEVKNDPRGDHPDWPQAARDILNAEQANYVVFMIGLNDRKSIRERIAARGTTTPATTTPGTPTTPVTTTATPAATETPAQPKPPTPLKPGEDSHDDEPPASEAAVPAVAEPDTPARGGRGAQSAAQSTAQYEFRSEKWVELYIKRIDETITALKSKNVPVFWVGLPPIRGTRSSSDATFLNDLYRSRAEKAGITYIDVWDGFVDEAGRFVNYGPDFEGQNRRLRSGDGVYFTKAGARKLAHYVEREIQRAMVAHAAPQAMPAPEEPTPQVAARPSSAPGATPRPLAGPVIPLTFSRDSDQLLGAGAAQQSIADAVASRVLVKGEPIAAPAGRSDDFVWPRRAIAPVGGDPVVATTTVPMTPMQPERPVAVAAAPATPAGEAGAAPARPRQQQPREAAARPRPPAPIQGQQQAQRDPRRYGGQPDRPVFYFPFFSRW
jgi:uncharacterized protein